MHDPRVGRFFATDLLSWKYPHYSPYAFSGNRVIDATELEGLEPTKAMIHWSRMPEGSEERIFGKSIDYLVLYHTVGLHRLTTLKLHEIEFPSQMLVAVTFNSEYTNYYYFSKFHKQWIPFNPTDVGMSADQVRDVAVYSILYAAGGVVALELFGLAGLGEEILDTVVEETTGIPMVTNIKDIAEETLKYVSKKGAKKFWNISTVYQGKKIYQRDDLIDPKRLDDKNRTNVERMEEGLAPIGPDGKSMEIHHLIQSDDGSFAEISYTMHKDGYGVIHIYYGKNKGSVALIQPESKILRN